jgi:hypothetical protein
MNSLKFNYYIIAVLLVLILLIIYGYHYYPAVQTEFLSQKIIDNLRTGDVVGFVGSGYVSHCIRGYMNLGRDNFTYCPYTHMGMIIRDGIHLYIADVDFRTWINDDVHVEDFYRYLSRHTPIVGILKNPYSSTLTLDRVLNLEKKFDLTLSMYTLPGRYTCSGFIHHLLMIGGTRFGSKQSNEVTPADFFNAGMVSYHHYY